MNVFTNLALRSRPTAVSSAAINTNPLPPQTSLLPIPCDSPTSESDDLRSQIFVNLTALNPEVGEKAIIYSNTNSGYYYTFVVDGQGRVRYSSLAQSCIEESLSVVLMLVWDDVVAMWRGEKMNEKEEEESDNDEEEQTWEEEDGYEDGAEDGERDGEGDSDVEESDDEDESDEDESDEDESDDDKKIVSAEIVDEDEDMDEEGDRESDEHKDDKHEKIEGQDEMDLD